MNKVIPFTSRTAERKNYIFRNRPVKIQAENIFFPCISLYDRKTDILVAYPGFERWYLKLTEAEAMASSTLQKRAYNICSFLNFILWDTSCDGLNEVTLNDIRQFILKFKDVDTENVRDLQSWNRGIADVYNFLLRYYEYNKEILDFAYLPEELFSINVVKDAKTGRKSIIRNYNKFSVKAPPKQKKKNRLLVHGYLDFMLYEASRYDPMLTFGIALQSYAGLREGEIVNLTRSSIQQIYAGFGQIGKITIDLTKEAPFRADGKTEFGSIKKYRRQEVYPDFILAIKKHLEKHEGLLAYNGASEAPDAPLFINKWNRPLSVTSYCGRLRNLFRNHFLPDLQQICMETGTWAENAAYIEAYHEEYPGAHMFRHWFTMYLVTKTDLSVEEIAKWRGDSSIESMMSYVHVNADMLTLYKDSSYRFQRSVLEEIL